VFDFSNKLNDHDHAPLNAEFPIPFGTLWGRSAAGALLFVRTPVAAVLLVRRRRVL